MVGVFASLPRNPETPPATAKAVFGHLILQVEGDVTSPEVMWITPKKAAYNPVRGTQSEFQLELLDGLGRVLGSYPLDLTHFDLNPANIGKPLKVHGCEVRDTKIATIVNVPFLVAATSLRIRRGKAVLSTLEAAGYSHLLAEGENR